MNRADRTVPYGVDIARPNRARAYDYLLGGSHNFAVDRELAHQSIALMPDLAMQAQANRAFLDRAVRYLVGQGVRQFLDIGSGIPTLGNVHEVAQRAAPDARVIYVDIDADAVAYSRHILAGNDRATAIQEDLRRPERILHHPAVGGLLDLDQPVAVLLVAMLHAIPDADDPHAAVARLRDALAPGSFLVLSHPTPEDQPGFARLAQLSRQGPTPVTPRTQVEIDRFFAGFELVPPGLVWAPLWRPEDPDEVDDPASSCNLVGVARRH